MLPHVLVVVEQRALQSAIARVLERHELRVTAVANVDAADRLARRFDAAVLHDKEDGSTVADAGWLLARGRIRVAVFFGSAEDTSHRLRAANLGSYVHTSEGLHRLAKCVEEALADARVALAVGADAEAGRGEHRSGKRRR